MPESCLSTVDGEVRVAIRVRPRAPRVAIESPRGGRLIVRVTAAPADGAANEAVRKLVAKRFGVAPSRTRIVRGETARDKLVAIEGIDAADARRVLSELKP